MAHGDSGCQASPSRQRDWNDLSLARESKQLTQCPDAGGSRELSLPESTKGWMVRPLPAWQKKVVTNSRHIDPFAYAIDDSRASEQLSRFTAMKFKLSQTAALTLRHHDPSTQKKHRENLLDKSNSFRDGPPCSGNNPIRGDSP